MGYQYVWFAWSLMLLGIWSVVYLVFRNARRRMLAASLITMPFGLTEPLFVPEYWHPPSLFDLAHRTGFDIESLLFCFGIGGLGIVLYDLVFRVEHRTMTIAERFHPRHRFHRWVLASPILTFVPMYFIVPWNVIYSASLAMFIGGLAAVWCRPDLNRKVWIGGTFFLLFYIAYFLPLGILAPGYVEKVWTLSALSGVTIMGIPIEELLFAYTFGMLWSSYYEHLTWMKIPVTIDHPALIDHQQRGK